MLAKMKRKMNKIDDNKLYSTHEIIELGLIQDTTMKPSVFTLYRLIKRKVLNAVNMSAGQKPKYFVKGKDLREFIANRYQFKIKS